MNKLNGKVAVVTGASKGIGAGIAKGLAEAGAAVVVNYASSPEGADRVVKEIQSKGGKALAVQGDVAKAGDVRRLFGLLEILDQRMGVSYLIVDQPAEDALQRGEIGIEALDDEFGMAVILREDDRLAQPVAAGHFQAILHKLLQHQVDGVVLSRRLCHRLRISCGRQRPLCHVDHEEGCIEPTAAHLGKVDLEWPVLARVELRILHVRQGDVDVRVEGEGVVLRLRRGAEEQDRGQRVPPHQKSIDTVSCPNRGGWKRIGCR